MNYLKVLRNNNAICSKTSYTSTDKQTAQDLTIRCVFHGNEHCSIGHRNLLLYSDSFLLINKGTQYHSAAKSEVPVQSFAISFDPRFIDDFNHSSRLSPAQLLDLAQNHTTMNELSETLYPFTGDLRSTVTHLKDYLDGGGNNELLINEYLHHCLITYNTVYNHEVYQTAEHLHVLSNSTRVEITRRLNLAREYLYSNFDKNVSLEDLAEHACLSVNHLLRTFKQAFGQTPHQFLTDVRLRRARYLLKSTDCSVNEIVNTVGFECSSSFIRLFKKKTHITPLVFRQTA